MSELFTRLQAMLYVAPVVLIAIIVHECAHGWMSYKLGDPTPKETGRLSLNPLKHLDLVGTLCLLVFHFGWAKPVQINPGYYKNKRKGLIAVSLAGPVSNFIMAFIFMFLFGLIYKYELYASTIGNIAFNLCEYAVIINIGLGLFNLIPLPPLDGSKVVMALSKKIAAFFYKYQQYSRIILVALLVSDVLTTPLNYLNSWIIDGMLFVVRLVLKI